MGNPENFKEIAAPLSNKLTKINTVNMIQPLKLKEFFPDLTDEIINNNLIKLLNIKESAELCNNCTGIDNCQQNGRVLSYEVVNRDVRERSSLCAKQLQKQYDLNVQRLLKTSRLSEYLRTKRFDNFNCNEHNKDAFDEAKRASREPAGKGLVLMGGTGCGKTHLAAAILNQRIEEGQSAIFCTVPELLANIKQTFGNDKTTSELIEMVKDCELLLLDDLGAEKATDWVTEQLFVIINARLLRGKQTVVTTNFTSNKELIDKLGGMSGQRIVSRLFEMCVFKRINGEDYRLKL